MFALKSISHDSISGALAKAERYRLLNEPVEAESICRDILEIEPDNQQALISLLLSLTDQLAHDPRAFTGAIAVVEKLDSPYDRAYYAGLAWERRARARHTGQGGHAYSYEWLVKALKLFEEAEQLRPAHNDDAVLRWNACVRFLQTHKLAPAPDYEPEAILSE
jgi:hypothetical protein